MKKLCVSVGIGLLSFSSFVNAQTESDVIDWGFPRKLRCEATTGIGKGVNLNTIQVTKCYPIDPYKIFSLGFGGRLNNLNYTNLAVHSVSSSSSGFESFSANGKVGNINLMISAELSWQSKVTLGANIDVFGFSLGGISPNADFTKRPGSKASKAEVSPKSLGVDVSDFNILKGRGKDVGTLNSEIYATYRLRTNLWLKAGFSHVFTDMIVAQVNDRFGAYTNLGIIGLRMRF